MLAGVAQIRAGCRPRGSNAWVSITNCSEQDEDADANTPDYGCMRAGRAPVVGVKPEMAFS